MENQLFLQKSKNNLVEKVICHDKMYMSAKNGAIITKFVVNIAINMALE
jgi:hypothetical protein